MNWRTASSRGRLETLYEHDVHNLGSADDDKGASGVVRGDVFERSNLGEGDAVEEEHERDVVAYGSDGRRRVCAALKLLHGRTPKQAEWLLLSLPPPARSAVYIRRTESGA